MAFFELSDRPGILGSCDERKLACTSTARWQVQSEKLLQLQRDVVAKSEHKPEVDVADLMLRLSRLGLERGLGPFRSGFVAGYAHTHAQIHTQVSLVMATEMMSLRIYFQASINQSILPHPLARLPACPLARLPALHGRAQAAQILEPTERWPTGKWEEEGATSTQTLEAPFLYRKSSSGLQREPPGVGGFSIGTRYAPPFCLKASA